MIHQNTEKKNTATTRKCNTFLLCSRQKRKKKKNHQKKPLIFMQYFLVFHIFWSAWATSYVLFKLQKYEIIIYYIDISDESS